MSDTNTSQPETKPKSHKAKRGLGLVVLGVILYLVFLATNEAAKTTYSASMLLVNLMVGLAMVASVVGGLVLIAWGLLRD